MPEIAKRLSGIHANQIMDPGYHTGSGMTNIYGERNKLDQLTPLTHCHLETSRFIGRAKDLKQTVFVTIMLEIFICRSKAKAWLQSPSDEGSFRKTGQE